MVVFFFFQAEDGIRDVAVTGVQTCALPIACCAPTGPSRSSLLPQADSIEEHAEAQEQTVGEEIRMGDVAERPEQRRLLGKRVRRAQRARDCRQYDSTDDAPRDQTAREQNS